VLRATEYVVPALEIVDARPAGPAQDLRHRSPTMAPPPASWWAAGRSARFDVDLRWVGGIMVRNSEIEETGVAAGVLGHPPSGGVLANKLARHGVGLERGHSSLPAPSPASYSPRRATRCMAISCAGGIRRSIHLIASTAAAEHNGDAPRALPSPFAAGRRRPARSNSSIPTPPLR